MDPQIWGAGPDVDDVAAITEAEAPPKLPALSGLHKTSVWLPFFLTSFLLLSLHLTLLHKSDELYPKTTQVTKHSVIYQRYS